MKQKRIADYGIRIGKLPKGPLNKITDVPGVTVGHWTLHDDRRHTGVTVILPGGNVFRRKCPAACHVVNGYGKTLGLVQIEELGVLESPIALTGTLNVGLVHDALVQYTLEECAKEGVSVRSVNPVVGECNDGTLGDNTDRPVGQQQVFAAIAAAEADFAEGAVGAGAGMICHELKGGIGSASRTLRLDGVQYTVGVLAQANHGQLADLRVNGEAVGRAIQKKVKAETPPRAEEKGSCMLILATDLPLSDRQLRRTVARCAVGLVRSGSYLGHGSGDVCIGFSTANRVADDETRGVIPTAVLNESRINQVFRAAAEAAEEAILNAMVCADGVVGVDGVPRRSLREFLE